MPKKLMLITAFALLVVALVAGRGAAFANGHDDDAGGPNDQNPTYTCSINIAEDQDNLAGLARITADQARAAALAANPGTTAMTVELDNENGCLVYSVELSNGVDVKVDAGNGQVVHTEAAGDDSGEHEGAEAPEAPDVED